MKEIRFEQQDSLQNQLLIFPMALGVGLFAYTTLTEDDSDLRWISALLGFGLLSFQLGKQFFFKNYVGWNRKGATVKINSIWPKSIRFSTITSYKVGKDELTLLRKDGTSFSFDLSGVEKESIDRLLDILKSHSIPNTV